MALQSHAIPQADRPPPDATTSALSLTSPGGGQRPPPPRWRQVLDNLQANLSENDTVRNVVASTRDRVSDLHEKWETSDSTMVHKLQDMSEGMWDDSAYAAAMREVRARDPAFDLPRFLRGIRDQVAPFEQAMAAGDMTTLERMCAPELMQALRDRTAALVGADLHMDPRVLSVDEVEMVAMELVDGGTGGGRDPAMVVDVRVQRVNCFRDKHGNVTQGGEDQIATLFYYWELQQESGGYVNGEGKWVAPRWQITNHVQRPEVLLLAV